MDLGARAVAMGGAYGAIGEDSLILGFNPAGLAGAMRTDVAFLHNIGAEEVITEVFAYGQPVADLGPMAATLVWRHLPPIDNPGAPDLAVNATDLVLTVGWGGAVGPMLGGNSAGLKGLAAGAAVKLIYAQLREAAAAGAAVDLGVRWTLDAALPVPAAVSIALQNLGPPMTFLEVADPLPLLVRAGAAVTPLTLERSRLLLGAEWVASPGAESRLSVGAEYLLAKSVAFRAGYAWWGTENLTGPSAGVGVNFALGAARPRIDYTYRFQNYLGWESLSGQHSLTVGVAF